MHHRTRAQLCSASVFGKVGLIAAIIRDWIPWTENLRMRIAQECEELKWDT